MSAIIERILDYLRVKEIRAQEVDIDKAAGRRHWPRMLSFAPGPKPCDDDSNGNSNTVDDDDGDDDDDDDVVTIVPCQDPDDDDDDDTCPVPRKNRSPSLLSRKLNCMYHSAKYGLKEGALSGIFFGGGWGIYKYVDAVYLKEGGKEGGEGAEEGAEEGEGNGEESGSTVNDNVIFVTAANGALAMGVFCTFFCCTKAAIYCN